MPSREALTTAALWRRKASAVTGAVCALKVTKQLPEAGTHSLTCAQQAWSASRLLTWQGWARHDTCAAAAADVVQSDTRCSQQEHAGPSGCGAGCLACNAQQSQARLGIVCARGQQGAIVRKGQGSHVMVVPLLPQHVGL